MTIDFKLSNSNLVNYARTDDSHEAFVSSVNNGQTKLALEVLVELIDTLVDKVNELEDKLNISSVPPTSSDGVKGKAKSGKDGSDLADQ